MTIVPLASTAVFKATPFASLAAGIVDGEMDKKMLRATARCEQETGHRLAPFVQTETQIVDNTDINDGQFFPYALPMQQQMQMDYARARGYAQGLARHFWVTEYPEAYSDSWTGAINSITASWALSATPITVPATSIQFQSDTGHGLFIIGTFVPQGSTLTINYSGGYTLIPADLELACINFAAAEIIKQLDPRDYTGHDPNMLIDDAKDLLKAYKRSIT